MLPEDYEKMMLIYLSSLVEGRGFRTVEDLNRLGAEEILRLAQKVDDSAIGFFIQLLKSSHDGNRLFEKLMGDHEEENRELVESFFGRYLNSVLTPEEALPGNPLEIYLPDHALDDLAFVQSRQAFFLRQTMDTINEYLQTVLGLETEFDPGCQEEAWKWFFDRLMRK